MVRRRRLTALAALVLVVVATLELVVGPADRRARQGASLERLELESEAVGRKLPIEVVVPEGGGEGRPLLVFLHGRGEGGEDDSLHQEMYAALAGQGERAPVIAFPAGGDHSYWHDRGDGAWGRYVTDEVIPRVAAEVGADPRRVAIGGISMGGFGSLDLARLHPGRFCAVGAHSPALWQTAGETAAGAFDDAADFERHDVVGAARSAPAPFLGRPVWLDSGRADPFRPGIDAFAGDLDAAGADLRFHLWPGAHEDAYWRRHWDRYLRFYARALARC